MRIAWIKEHIERALTTPGQELGRWAQFVRFQVGLWRFCARRLRENNLVALSAALSYRTIFALIPVLVLAFLVLKSVGALEDSKRSLRSILEASGFTQIIAVPEDEHAGAQLPEMTSSQPAEVINVADKIEELVTQVEGKLTFERIGPIGGALLIWTALTLLTTVERSLNRIFGAPRSRSLTRRILLYWSAMTLGPLALTATAYMGQDIVNTFRDAPGLSWLLVAIGWGGPIIVGVLLLSVLYTLVPNTAVRYRAALGGAAVAVPLWLVAKWGFAVYVERLVITGNLYGVLGALPLFLLWLNVSWLIFLFGAQLAHTAGNLTEMRLAEDAERSMLGPSDVLAVLLAIAQPYHAGKGLVTLGQITARLNLAGESVQRLVDELRACGLVCVAAGQRETGYALVRPTEKIAILDVLRIGDPRGALLEHGSCDVDIAAAVSDVQRRAQSSLAGLMLADVLDVRRMDNGAPGRRQSAGGE